MKCPTPYLIALAAMLLLLAPRACPQGETTSAIT